MSHIRTPYETRLKLQEELHLVYGKLYMTNIDSINDLFVEISDDGERTLAYVEFKNDYESIKPFSLKSIKNDCNQLGRPFYISILYRTPMIHYYIVPINQAARNIPNMEKAKFWTERQYVWMLHKLRNKSASKEQLSQFAHELPKPLSPLNPYLDSLKGLIDE